MLVTAGSFICLLAILTYVVRQGYPLPPVQSTAAGVFKNTADSAAGSLANLAWRLIACCLDWCQRVLLRSHSSHKEVATGFDSSSS
jgi:hypothetical protein